MMQVILIDKEYRFLPHMFEKLLVAKFEVTCSNDDELMAILKAVNAIEPDTIATETISDSGVQNTEPPKEDPKEDPKSNLKTEKKEDVEIPQIDPISSLEIE